MFTLTGGLVAGLIIGVLARENIKVKYVEESIFWLAVFGMTYTLFSIVVFLVEVKLVEIVE